MLTTKIHVTVDAARKTTALSLALGQKADIVESESLLDELDPEAFLAMVQLVGAIIGINRRHDLSKLKPG